MLYRWLQAFGNIGPGFGYQAPWQRQGLALDQLNQQPQPAQPEEAQASWPARASQSQKRAQIGQIGLLVARTKLQIAAERDHPQRSDRHGQPQPCHSRWLAHLGLLPLPAAALGAFESLLAPRTQAVPLGIAACAWQIGQHEPRFGMSLAPPGHQCAVQLAAFRGKGRSGSAPALTELTYQLAQPHELGLAQ